MKLPPCKKDGKDCAERRTGCSASCKEFIEWHYENIEKPKAARAKVKIVDGFVADVVHKSRATQSRCKGKVKMQGPK